MTLHCVCSRINLQMDVELAARLVALRPPLEALMIRATKDPEGVEKPGPQEESLMALLRALSRPNTGRFGISDEGYVCVYGWVCVWGGEGG